MLDHNTTIQEVFAEACQIDIQKRHLPLKNQSEKEESEIYLEIPTEEDSEFSDKEDFDRYFGKSIKRAQKKKLKKAKAGKTKKDGLFGSKKIAKGFKSRGEDSIDSNKFEPFSNRIESSHVQTSKKRTRNQEADYGSQSEIATGRKRKRDFDEE